MSKKIVVIGAGAAGMMAAGTAAQLGAQVVLIEQNARTGRKIMITGKGRCNVTNNCDRETMLANVATNPKFLYSAVAAFSPQDTMSFFESLGVPLKTERGRRVFPVSDCAADINDALHSFCKRNGVKIIQAKAKELDVQEGRVCAVVTDRERIDCDACIVATGGASYSSTGSDGSGYVLARSAGHDIITPTPSLVPVVFAESGEMKPLQGLSLKNISLNVLDLKGHVVYKDFGELLFTFFGASGPTVLSASARMKFDAGQKYIFSIDLKPALSNEQLDARIVRDFAANSNRDFANSLGGLLPKKLISTVIARSGIPRDVKANSITRTQRKALVEVLKGLKFTVTGLRPLEEAIVTSGGVKVTQINARTMESKAVKALYFAGEVIDVDAYTGGYNLQIAFSTGYLAGRSAAES